MPGVIVHQDGTDGVNVVSHVDMFDAIAEIMQPRRRRTVNLTPEQREAIGKRLTEARKGQDGIVQTPGEAEFCVPAVQVDTLAMPTPSNA